MCNLLAFRTSNKILRCLLDKGRTIFLDESFRMILQNALLDLFGRHELHIYFNNKNMSVAYSKAIILEVPKCVIVLEQ